MVNLSYENYCNIHNANIKIWTDEARLLKRHFNYKISATFQHYLNEPSNVLHSIIQVPAQKLTISNLTKFSCVSWCRLNYQMSSKGHKILKMYNKLRQHWFVWHLFSIPAKYINKVFVARVNIFYFNISIVCVTLGCISIELVHFNLLIIYCLDVIFFVCAVPCVSIH